ncbi:MAG: amidase [Pseudomonadota bacterium]
MKRLFFVAAIAAGLASCAQQEDPPAETIQPSASYAPEGITAKSLPEIRDAVANGELTAEALVKAYLDRINAIDRAGPKLQSIITVNPNALEEAKALDAKRDAGETLAPLHGVPVLLKDNIETADQMATTAGALALKDNMTGRDSPLAAGLRDAGAIILGKANLSQWANFRSNDSMSGWSALGGQVRNPHMLDRNPCGSSSGSGAAAAASLAAGTVGTETNGSIICPSTINGVVGFKPTVGLVSQEYIIPISSSQDTAGPMTKTVKGAAIMLNAMATGPGKVDYVSALDENKLKGARVGVLRFAQGSSNDIIARFDAALEAMQNAGAELVAIEEFSGRGPDFGKNSRAVLDYEFKATINDYLANTPVEGQPRNLADLIAFNEANADVELALFDQSIFVEAMERGGLDSPEYLEARASVQRSTGVEGIDKLLADYNVDILVSPSGPIAPRVDPVNGDTWPAWAGAGWMAAIAGYPHASVPMGTVHGLPVGVSFIGEANDDAEVLSYAYAYEQKTLLRAEPQYLNSAEDRPEIAGAMNGLN